MTDSATAARALALGLATGGRSTAGLTALAATSGPVWVKLGTAALAAGELVADKLPNTPSRLDPGPLAGRAVFGGLGALLLARRRGQSWPIPVLLGTAGALAGSWLGVRYRSMVSKRGVPPLAGALVEDTVVLALAGAAVR